jgi:hypothetical protein
MDVLGNPSLLSSVIRRTNTQNPMKLLNLSAHDPFQLNIARYLDRYKIFYERREKEWTNEKKTMLVDYVPVNIKDVAQWLSTLHQDIGFGRARSRVAELFQTRFYKEIFGDFDSEFKSTSYKSLASIVWSGLFVQMLLYYLKPNTKKFGKMSQLLLVRAVYDSINRSLELHSQIETLFNNHRYGSRWIPSHTRTVVKGFVKKFIQIQKTVQKRDFNIDFSNFFKRDDLTKIAYRRVCSNKSLQKLSKSIERHINQIE